MIDHVLMIMSKEMVFPSLEGLEHPFRRKDRRLKMSFSGLNDLKVCYSSYEHSSSSPSLSQSEVSSYSS